MKIDRMFGAMGISSEGLRAQRKKMNAIAQNIANAETTRTEDGTPYRRLTVQMKATRQATFSSELQNTAFTSDMMDSRLQPGNDMDGGVSNESSMMLEATEVRDPSPFRMVYNPGHPDADERGYVKMPNVNIVTEMVDMIAASRAFEANVVAIGAQKGMAKDSLEI